ncbi:MAG: AraC family transcriptional regulator [Candidatus Eremiobacteraeota bacterium]|nr:AraC family transcriptional regulator [Candidatus Eremiobacteraeota bacterium]
MRRVLYYPRLRRVADYVATNLERPIRLSDAASTAFMQEAAFSRYFTTKAGMAFSEFVRTLRIVRAIEMIDAEDCTFKELSRSLGFATISTFARNFHTIVGCSPREYKRRTLTGAHDPLTAGRRGKLLAHLALLRGDAHARQQPFVDAAAELA